uniref:Uncharacterized protein n=1 Tax=Arundo donax TaxID=35708 RepID=A0A0A9G760_ARUDO
MAARFMSYFLVVFLASIDNLYTYLTGAKIIYLLLMNWLVGQILRLHSVLSIFSLINRVC